MLNSAVAVELFHNAFLIHDDIQDQSLLRRGAAALYRQHGVGIAINVGNATNLLALQRIVANRSVLGPQTTWLIMKETEHMMRQSLEGQAIELGWIRDNIYDLQPRDYLAMCLKKTSWYSFIYPLRIGATIAQGVQNPNRFCMLGAYLGAAFQMQDDILNLTSNYRKYGKEIMGDLREGKRTLIVIRLLSTCSAKDGRTLRRILSKSGSARTDADLEWIYDRIIRYKCIEFSLSAARQLAGAALLQALADFRGVPDSEYKRFILEMVLYVINRDR